MKDHLRAAAPEDVVQMALEPVLDGRSRSSAGAPVASGHEGGGGSR
jgi:hypothetical protein